MDILSFMALFALAAFWVNTLLIAAAAVQTWRRVTGQHAVAVATAKPGMITAGAGPGGALAAFCVRQVGRARPGGPVLFHDRARTSQVFGGTVAVDGGEAIDVSPDAPATVWTSASAQAHATATPPAELRRQAQTAAVKAAGWERSVAVPLVLATPVWVGRSPSGEWLLADRDPRRWRRKVTAITAVMVVGLLVGAAACTVACLWPPVFGTVSKLGAVAALVVFNLFQLFGKLHHDAIQPPGARTLAGQWPAVTS